MRRALVGLALVAIAAIAVVAVLLLRSDEDVAVGTVVRGREGFPLRGSLAADRAAVDGAVKAWREDIADGDEDDASLAERRPAPADPVTALWIGDPGTGSPIAVLEHDDLLVELIRREDGWEIVDERFRAYAQGPHSVGSAIVVPVGADWTYLKTNGEDGFKATGDGLFYSERRDEQAGFLVADRATDGPYIGIDAIGPGAGGARRVPRDGLEAFRRAMDDEGARRAVWLASSALEEQAGTSTYEGDPPELTVTWTGAVPGGEPAALAVLRDGDRLGAALGYGEDGELGLGTGPDDDTFAGGAIADLDGRRLVLAGGGDVETIEAKVGEETVRGKAPVTVVDAAGLDEDADVAITGRTGSGEAVEALTAR